MVFFLLVWLPSLLHFPLLLLHFRKEDREEGLSLRSQLPKNAALVIDSDLESSLAVEEFTPGFLFRLEPGEIVPLDGNIITGSGFFDESNLGGAETKSKGPGATIYAGTTNKNGKIIARCIRKFQDCKINIIIQQRLTDRPSKLVLSLSLLLGLLPFCFVRSISQFILAFLFASPSAFFLAQIIPYRLTRMRLRSQGLFFPNEKVMAEQRKVEALLFNPYLALSAGRPVLSEIKCEREEIDEAQLLSLGFGLSRYDDSPLSSALTQLAKDRQVPALLVEDWKKEKNGLTGCVDGQKLQLLFSSLGGNRALALQFEGGVLGYFVFQDTRIKEAKALCSALKALRVAPIAVSEMPRSAMESFCEGLEIQEMHGEIAESDEAQLLAKLQPLNIRRIAYDENLSQYLLGIGLIRKKRIIKIQNLILFCVYIGVGAWIVSQGSFSLKLLAIYFVYQLSLFMPIINAMRL